MPRGWGKVFAVVQLFSELPGIAGFIGKEICAAWVQVRVWSWATSRPGSARP